MRGNFFFFHGEFVFFYSAARYGGLEMAQLLVQHGAPVNAQDN